MEAQLTGETVLVRGGSTSVGSNAMQLAVAAGYEVITTASPVNFTYAKAFGAAIVFDYRNPTVTANILRVFAGRSMAGALAIGIGSAPACLDIVGTCAVNRRLAMPTPAISFAIAPSGFRRKLWLIPTLGRMIASTAILLIRARRRGARTKFAWVMYGCPRSCK
jgi:hypothetical protein